MPQHRSIHRYLLAAVLAGAFAAGSLAAAAQSASGTAPKQLAGDPPVGPGWSNDAAANLALADRSGEETQAKILPRSDGGFYVSWFDNSDGGFDVRLQRLDAQGRELWPHNGVLVADRNYASTTDYGFSVDTAGNAVLSFQCCTPQAADERLVVVKVAVDGSLAWSGGRVAVSTPGEGALVSFAAATSDGNSVIVWMNGSGVGCAQKLSADGMPLWGATGVNLPGPASGLKFVADVIASSNGDALVSWSNQAGSTRILRVQRLASADGAAQWGNDGVRVADLGNLGAGYFPKMTADGSGGAVFAYKDFIGTASFARVQHVSGNGTRMLGDSGTLATTNATRAHNLPMAHYDTATGDIYLVWTDTTVVGTDSTDGLFVQRIDAAGQRRWGEEGRELVPMTVSTNGSESLSQTQALPAPGGFLAAWVTGNSSVSTNPIRVQRLDVDGALVWRRAVQPNAAPRRTSRLTGTTSTDGYAAFVWSDGPGNDNGLLDVHAQNLNYNGSFGDTLFRDGLEE